MYDIELKKIKNQSDNDAFPKLNVNPSLFTTFGVRSNHDYMFLLYSDDFRTYVLCGRTKKKDQGNKNNAKNLQP